VRRAGAGEQPALAAILLANAAQTLAWSDPVTAQRHAREGVSRARQSGMPYAIAYNLQGLAHALASTDPSQAHAVLSEALQLSTTLGHESPGGLTTAVFAAARLEEWPALLRAASSALHHQARSSALGYVYLAAILNLVARGLAKPQPEAAAVIQGTVTGILGRITPAVAAPVGGNGADQNDVAKFVMAVRRETTELLTAAIGQARLHELRTRGVTMDETQACVYARARIDEYLTQTLPTVN
jgi:hypothetical protein